MRLFLSFIILLLNVEVSFAEDTPEIPIPESKFAQEPETKECADIRKLIETGKLEEAERLCNGVLFLNPEDTRNLFLHSEIMCGLGRYVDALVDMDFAIALVPDEPEYFLRRSYVKCLMGTSEDALSDMREAENYGLRSPSSYELYGRLLVSLGAYDVAKTKYDYTLEHDPHFYKALQGRAVIELQKDDYTAACMDIERMLQNSEVDEYAHFLKARLFEEQHNDYEQALIELAMALEINPNFYGGYRMRMKYFNKLQIYDKAIEDAQFLISAEQGGADAWYTKAYAQGRIGKQTDAILSLDRAISMSQNDWSYYHERAINFYELNRYREAIPDYTKYIENAKQDIDAYIYRGFCFHRIGKFENAISDYTIAINAYPKSGDIYNLRADSFFENGDYVSAIKDRIKAQEIATGREFFSEDTKTSLMYSVVFMLIMGILGLCVLLWFLLKKNKPYKAIEVTKSPPKLPPSVG